jgi:hypothetical protein
MTMTSTLTDYLQAMPDEALASLLSRRPDVLTPPPSDLSGLAARLQSRVSIARALDGLDLFHTEILDACRLTRISEPPHITSTESILAITTAVDPAVVRSTLRDLQDLFLVYGRDDALAVLPGVDEVANAYPAGLGRPAELLDATAGALAKDAAGLRRALLAASPASRAVLDRLAAGPPVGTVAKDTITNSDSAVGALVTRGLLVATADDTVELPREVAVALRRDGMLGPLHPQPPVFGDATRPVKLIDNAGAGQVMEVTRHTETMLEALAEEPAAALRTGGIGVRDLRRLARAAGIDETVAALLIEVATAAGLIGEADGGTLPGGGLETRFLPTLAYDQWAIAGTADRWLRLARAWLTMNRQPGLVGRRGAKGDRPGSVLGPELERTGAPRLRAAVLDVLATAPPGGVPTVADVLAVVHWRSPRRSPWQPAGGADPQSAVAAPATEPVRWALDEASALGLTGLGGLTSYGRALLTELFAEVAADRDDDPLGLDRPEATVRSRASSVLGNLLPAPVDHFLVQADLTIVVPGPPEPELAAELAALADHESAGGAVVYRVTRESIRRALDAGYTASDLQQLVKRRSRTGVPQALSYAIEDVARRHGGLRLGGAGCYLRSEDAALLVEINNDRRLADLQLRLVAPTVLISPYLVSRVLNGLRDNGYAPVQEDSGGGLVLARPRTLRAPARRTPLSLASYGDGIAALRVVSPPRLAAVVEALRAGEAAARHARRAPVSVRTAPDGASAQAHTQAMAVLQQAIRDKARVWVGYVDAHGATVSRLLRPVSMGAGYLRAEDERTEMLHTFALHRITAAVLDA